MLVPQERVQSSQVLRRPCEKDVKLSFVENGEDTLRAKLVCDLLNAFRAFSDEAGKLRLQFLRAKEPMSLESYDAFHKQLIAEENTFERYLKLREELIIMYLK